jgi:hypothetical protein
MIRKETAAVAVLLLLAISLAGAARGEERDYYPTREGFTKSFKGETHFNGRVIPNSTRITIMGWTNLDGNRVLPMKVDFTSGDRTASRIIYDQVLPEGVKLVAEKGASDATPRLKRQDNWEFKTPLAVGNSWVSHNDTTYTRRRVTYPATTIIESMDEVVTVPAGTFEHCMKITSRFEGKVDLGSYDGTAELTVESVYWYAPGVGEIKTMRTEKSADPRLGKGGEFGDELVSFQ